MTTTTNIPLDNVTEPGNPKVGEIKPVTGGGEAPPRKPIDATVERITAGGE